MSHLICLTISEAFNGIFIELLSHFPQHQYGDNVGICGQCEGCKPLKETHDQDKM